MIVTIDQKDLDWDAFVQKHGGNFLQSWAWSEFQEAVGRKAFRFRVSGAPINAGELNTVAQFVMIDLPLPLGKRYLYVPRGPVMKPEAGESAVEALRERLLQEGAAFARVEWPLPVDADAAVTEERARGWGFVPAGHVQPQHTVINDLSLTEEAMLAAMHQKTRYNIRVAEKHGVNVRESSDAKAFIDMMAVTAARDGFHAHEASYYQKMLEVLGGRAEGLRVRLWLAEFEGRPVAGAMTAEFGDTVTYLHGASLDADRRVMGPFALHWQIMRAAKAAGFAKYDFWGVAPEGADGHSWAGITRFKTGFGGKRVSYLGAWELPGNALWYRVYRVAKRLRRGR